MSHLGLNILHDETTTPTQPSGLTPVNREEERDAKLHEATRIRALGR